MTIAPAVSTYPKARRIRFRFDQHDSNDKYFVDGDMVFSHFVAGLSGGFPPGEESFIRSVRRVAERVTDPLLKKRVTGFVGQEATHGQEHRKLNDKLIEMGYPIAWIDTERAHERMLGIETRLSPLVHLAATAAAEHYTAVLAERVLSSAEIQSIPAAPEFWNLLNWHALEELEHKSVAFDVFRAVGGTEPVRIGVMVGMYALTLPFTFGSLAVALARDPVARQQPARVAREAYDLFRGPIFRGLMVELAKYLRPGFHPDDIDTTALLNRWQRELFGDDGALVDHLK
ncbi:metal-dependent hydrolase [Nocardia sp. NBC_01503]|uniref:metal-dependent hydrolase n=1 Tax=Nocardia sp. NBC_01503 TaxID=2975997 RepID=UPI002E7B1935|nr:metal-dependent hydrolase [Nocardia sp. NBC_01503]WTL33530.1 metal-dependent hydrolase [Nocardia sp. NBC_01503]